MSRARRTKAAKATTAAPTPGRDTRLPAPGGVIEKVFKGKALKVEVTEAGFRYDGEDWKSLTALALHITGYGAVSGPAFFGLAKRKSRPAEPPATTPQPRKRAPKRGKE